MLNYSANNEININEINYIIEIDKAFINLKSEFRNKNKHELFNKYIFSISEYLNIPPNEISSFSLFNNDISAINREFISICILRLLSINNFNLDDFFKEKYKVYALFDSSLEIIYKSKGITKLMQNYEKEQKLRDFCSTIENNIEDVINSVSNIDAINIFRNKYTKSIKNNVSSFILSEFIGKHLVSDARLNDLFKPIEAYVKKQETSTITMEDYNLAINSIEDYIEEAKKVNTDYCNRFILSFSKKLLDLIQEDISNFEQFNPTILDIECSDKKYPLYDTGRDIQLCFNIVNKGSGYAYNIEITIKELIDNLRIKKSSYNISVIEAGTIGIKVPIEIVSSEEMGFVEVEVTWQNFDKTSVTIKKEIELEDQKRNIDWERLKTEQPYSLEAVETQEELIGRAEILNKLIQQTFTSKSVGSCYIHGQKRVGKTSIVKALSSKICNDDFIVVFLESGDYLIPSIHDTVNKLGESICLRIKNSNRKYYNIDMPEFNVGALSPIVNYLETLSSINNNMKVLIILDEFDELPKDLYKRGIFGDALFLSIRSISQKPKFGFILVGGEKIENIISCQGHNLNKFSAMRVDYFDKENYWDDFSELIRKPISDWMEISDDAINILYQETAGNPYYTKLICGSLFNEMVSLRDSHISKSEIEIAIKKTLSQVSSNSFQHFWEDGISEESPDLCEEESVNRRKVLLSFASILRDNKKPTKELLINNELLSSFSKDYILSIVDQFCRRNIFINNGKYYNIKIKFFEKWLVSNGYNEIITTFIDKDTIIERKCKEEAVFVTPEEISELTDPWPTYKGIKISDDRVRMWLNQFGSNINQRIMFKLLQSVNFYSDIRVREKLKQAHEVARKGITLVKKNKQRKTKEFLVSYLDSPGKSGGGVYAKMYADINKIYHSYVITKDKIADELERNNDVEALIFIDDFIGTGGTAQKYLKEIDSRYGNILRNKDIKIFFLAICGFGSAKDKLDDFIEGLSINVETHICDTFYDEAKLLSDQANIFENPEDRIKAHDIVYEYGAKLVKDNFLGYGNCQTAVIFENNCPNNNLPIFWAKPDNGSWFPLFSRK